MAQQRLFADHPLQDTYRSMISRCYHKANQSYEKYGGRGITVCERWLSNRKNGGKTSEGFKNFIKDMGPKPSEKHSLDRINNDQGYFPENCRWATRTEQQLNRNSYKNQKLRGEKHHQNKLTETEVLEIKKALLNPRRGLITELSKKYKVDRRNIYAIQKGESWSWLEITPHTHYRFPELHPS
jgi:hypothetical protein